MAAMRCTHASLFNLHFSRGKCAVTFVVMTISALFPYQSAMGDDLFLYEIAESSDAF